MKDANVRNHPKNQLTGNVMTVALNNTMKNQFEEEHINELQEWEGLSSG